MPLNSCNVTKLHCFLIIKHCVTETAWQVTNGFRCVKLSSPPYNIYLYTLLHSYQNYRFLQIISGSIISNYSTRVWSIFITKYDSMLFQLFLHHCIFLLYIFQMNHCGGISLLKINIWKCCVTSLLRHSIKKYIVLSQVI